MSRLNVRPSILLIIAAVLLLAPNAWAQPEPPTFSHAAGYHTTTFALTLSAEEGEIRYTVNGAEPEASSALYTTPLLIEPRDGQRNVLSMIPTNIDQHSSRPDHPAWQPPEGEVFKIAVVRARTFVDGEASEVATRSFIVDPAGASRFNLPVLSLATHPDNLFDDEVGIYVPGNDPEYNYEQRGREAERPTHFEFFENDGTLAVAQDIGIRIHGSASRVYPRKGLRVYARSDYGESWINYPILPHQPVSRYKRLILRNSGQDWGTTVLRDGTLQSLMRGMNIHIRDYRPAIVFLNGEYWGIHNIRDRHDDRYLQSHYGMDPDDVVLLEFNGVYDDGNEDGRRHYLDMYAFIEENSLAEEETFDYVETMMDMDSFIDMTAGNVYVMNTDWPGNNIAYWRYIRDDYDPDAPYGYDGRWRWFINDLDGGFMLHQWVTGADDGVAHNTLAFALEPDGTSWPNPAWSTLLLRRLVENDGFRTRFINRFADLLNTRFTSEAALDAIDESQAALAQDIEEHIHRWRRPADLAEWNDNVDVMRDFAVERTDLVRGHIADVFDLPGTALVTLSVAGTEAGGHAEPGVGGAIQVNSVRPDVSAGWQGTYFQTVPVELVAHPTPGYRFVEWTGSVEATGDTLHVTLTDDIALEARFEYHGDFAGDEMNPAPFALTDGPFSFTSWSPDEPELAFPDHMVFQQSTINDPGINDEMSAPYFIAHDDYHANDQDKIGFPYSLTGRTRVTGLGDDGVSFINTGRGRDVGAAVVALNTRGMENVMVSWVGGTVNPQSRQYRIRLQYRVGTDGPFADVLDSMGQPIEYVRHDEAGHEEMFGPIALPAGVNDEAYVQLRWRHYFSGIGTSGPRDELRLDDIFVFARPVSAQLPIGEQGFALGANFPNPFTGSTTIPFELEASMHVNIEIYNVLGQRVAQLVDTHLPAGTHTVDWSGNAAAGVYFYRLSAGSTADGSARVTETKSMIVH